MKLWDLGPDRGAPISLLGAGMWLDLAQYTDGTQPAAVAVFDNVELRAYEVPQDSIGQAVQITWPAPSGVNYALEAAPTVQGPFLPVQQLALPGLQKQTVPLSGAAQFFRVVEAP